MSDASLSAPTPGRPAEVLRVFLRLGLTSFGGPIAHIGFFREEFVARRRWLSEAQFAELVALAQVAPGPASSQVGLALGLLRAGPAGAAAAWVGFTLPSALLMVAFAAGLASAGGLGAAGWLIGLKAAAVAVVAQALWGMARSLAPDAPRQTLMAAAAAVALLVGGAPGQLGAIALGAVVGLALPRGPAEAAGAQVPVPVSRRAGAVCLALFALLLIGLPLVAALSPLLGYADGFYRAGALVFGGGHVLLPLLEAEAVGRGWVDREVFVAGYGAAQALPGPLFAFAAHLGQAAGGAGAAAVALVAVFLPGALLIVGALPFWQALRGRPALRAALAGINAAVAGLLLAALYDPVFLTGAATAFGFALALGCLTALAVWRVSPVWVVAGAAAAAEAVARLAPGLLT